MSSRHQIPGNLSVYHNPVSTSQTVHIHPPKHPSAKTRHLCTPKQLPGSTRGPGEESRRITLLKGIVPHLLPACPLLSHLRKQRAEVRLNQGQRPSWVNVNWKTPAGSRKSRSCQCLSVGRRLRAWRPRGPRRALVASLCCAKKDWAWAGACSSPARCSKAMPMLYQALISSFSSCSCRLRLFS